jgi:hypothetical protein
VDKTPKKISICQSASICEYKLVYDIVGNEVALLVEEGSIPDGVVGILD